VYYCSLIYELCLHKCAHFFILTATSQNSSASLKISLPYQVCYQHLLDNPVSGPSFVPTVIAALHPSNRILIKMVAFQPCNDLVICFQTEDHNSHEISGLLQVWNMKDHSESMFFLDININKCLSILLAPDSMTIIITDCKGNWGTRLQENSQRLG